MLFGSFVSCCYLLSFSSQNVCVEALTVFVTVFGDREGLSRSDEG